MSQDGTSAMHNPRKNVMIGGGLELDAKRCRGLWVGVGVAEHGLDRMRKVRGSSVGHMLVVAFESLLRAEGVGGQ